MKKTLKERLTKEQIERLEAEAIKWPTIGESIENALTSKYWITDLTVGEASSISTALGKSIGEIYNIFTP